MRVLVIGGTGFIGPYVVRCLYNMGHEISVFHRGQTEADLPKEIRHIHNASFNLGERRQFNHFKDDFKRLAPDVVLDMIPMTQQDAQALMITFSGIARRVIALSSQDVYLAYSKLKGSESGPEETTPIPEGAPLRRRLYPYRNEPPRDMEDPQKWIDDYDKILVERVVMSYPDLPGTILRLPMVYGPGDKQHRLFEYLKRMDDRRPVILLDKGLAQWRWTRGYVENVASAIALVVRDESSAGRIYNLGEVEALPETGWVEAIGKAAEWNGEIVVVPTGCLPAHLHPNINTRQHMVVDTTRIREELGYRENVDRDEALRRTVHWERTHPPQEPDLTMFDYASEDAVLAELTQYDV
ncbi:MAG: NAD-dependent dehydratase [Spirochaetes bacterium]|nr:MAG: NAD-dependent dehydratase [Spirochaetota bacterium]